MAEFNSKEELAKAAKNDVLVAGKIRVVSSARLAYLDVDVPTVLGTTELPALIDALGADIVFKKTMDQVTIDFRQLIRGKMESVDKESEMPKYDLTEIAGADYAEWAPELRIRQTPEEKVAKSMGNMSIDQIKAALAASGVNIKELMG
jgi:hypothetical protein